MRAPAAPLQCVRSQESFQFKITSMPGPSCNMSGRMEGSLNPGITWIARYTSAATLQSGARLDAPLRAGGAAAAQLALHDAAQAHALLRRARRLQRALG